MKKLMSLFLALAMLLGMSALAETAVDYTGYWVMAGMEISGSTYSAADLGLDGYMEIYADGTCQMVLSGVAEQGTWVATDVGIDTTDASGVVDSFTYVDGCLVVSSEGSALYFVREEYTVPLSGLTMVDFNGDWSFAYLEYLSEAYAAADVGMTMDLHLADGQGHIVMTYDGGTEEYDVVCESEEISGFGTALYCFYLDETGAKTENGMAMLLFDNGELVWYAIDEENNELYYCFELVTAE